MTKYSVSTLQKIDLQKKRKDMVYKLLEGFPKKYLYLQEMLAGKKSFITYVRMLFTGWFILNGILMVIESFLWCF